MSLTVKKTAGVKFLNIRNGAIQIKDDPNNYECIQGMFRGVRYTTTKFKEADVEFMNIDLLSEDGTTYVLCIGVRRSYWANICGSIVSSDPTKPISIYFGLKDKEGGKDPKTIAWVKQEGETIKSRYRKETAREVGLPEWKKVVFNKKEQWDYSEWEDFIRKEMEAFCASLPTVPQTQEPSAEVPNKQETTPTTKVVEDDDLPF